MRRSIFSIVVSIATLFETGSHRGAAAEERQ